MPIRVYRWTPAQLRIIIWKGHAKVSFVTLQPKCKLTFARPFGDGVVIFSATLGILWEVRCFHILPSGTGETLRSFLRSSFMCIFISNDSFSFPCSFVSTPDVKFVQGFARSSAFPSEFHPSTRSLDQQLIFAIHIHVFVDVCIWFVQMFLQPAS